jgi:RHS repeat-associated protein
VDEAFGHLDAWRAQQAITKEARHRAARQSTLALAKRHAEQDIVHYYLCDHLGTPLDLVDADGTTVWTARYRAWGGIFSNEVSAIAQPLRFQGQYEDAETGFHYNRFRYYDPHIGRFITQDPIHLGGGENLYQYGPNSI